MLAALDIALLRLLRTRLHGPRAERAVVAYTRLGEHGLLWHGIAATGWALDRPCRAHYVRAVRTVAIAYALNTAVKQVVRRARPELAGLPALTPTVSRMSWPSAHASTSFAAARALRRALPAPALYALAGLMALSRPYVGVHWPSDIAAGALLGAAVEALAP